MARKIPEINASSMADIAFMLLIFFLVATTMKKDKGILTTLPPYVPPTEEPPKLNNRDVFVVLINRNNDLLVEGEILEVNELRDAVMDWYTNPSNSKKYPIKKQKSLPKLGNVTVAPNAVISLQTDIGTEYGVYLQVYNELLAAIRLLRDQIAKERIGKSYADCSPQIQKLIRKEIYPQHISQADPKDVN